MANARFHATDAQMLYTRVATGYRPGGANGILPGIPPSYAADTLTDYEVGYKATLFDQRLRLETDAFYIDWNRIQMQVPNAEGLIYTGNGGNAVSQGEEMSLAYIVATGFRLGANLSHTDAHLTQNAPSLNGKVGNQLPDSPRWSAALTADFEHPLTDDVSITMGAAYRYRDGVDSQFADSPAPEPVGPLNITDVYLGTLIRAFTARLYVKNVFADRAYTGLLYLTNPALPEFVPVQPRTVGLSLDYRF
jgi:outer membrane receptor protein involved in Fe transport